MQGAGVSDVERRGPVVVVPRIGLVTELDLVRGDVLQELVGAVDHAHPDLRRGTHAREERTERDHPRGRFMNAESIER